MGLLDNPRDEALMALGLGLLNSKGSFGNALGQAGMQSMQVLNQAKDRERMAKMQALQEEMARANLETMRRQQAQALKAEQFREQLQSPQQQMLSQALGGGGGPTMANAANLKPVDPNQSLMFEAMKAGLVDPVQYIASQAKAKKPVISKPGDIARDEESGRVLWQNPDKEDKLDPNKPFMVIDGKIVPNPAYQQYAERVARAGSSSVSFGTGATPMQMPDGSLALVQLSGKPGVAPQIVKDPASGTPLRPPPQNRDTKLPAELQRMQIAGDAMIGLLDKYEALIKTHNPRDPMVQANPTIRANIESVKRNLELQFKELQALGALAGPDIEIMRQALADPFSFKGAYYGKDGLLAQTRQARELVKLRSDAVIKSQGRQVDDKADDNDPLGIRKP